MLAKIIERAANLKARGTKDTKSAAKAVRSEPASKKKAAARAPVKRKTTRAKK